MMNLLCVLVISLGANVCLTNKLADAKGITVGELIMTPINKVVDTVVDFSNKVISTVNDTIDTVKATVRNTTNTVVFYAEDTVDTAIITAIDIADKTVDYIEETINNCKEAITNVKEFIVINCRIAEEMIVKKTYIYKAMQENHAALLERISALESIINNANEVLMDNNTNEFTVEQIDGYETNEIEYVRDENGNWIAVDIHYKKVAKNQ